MRPFALVVVCCCLMPAAQAQEKGSATPQTLNGLVMSVGGVERASSVGLTDCPPGANTVRGMTKPGEEFAVVTVQFKVLPSFTAATALKKPVLNGADGKSYNTAVSFVDVGTVAEFACRFPFRVAQGTKLESLQIDKVTFDLTKLGAPKP
jgi:hypothetical protein